MDEKNDLLGRTQKYELLKRKKDQEPHGVWNQIILDEHKKRHRRTAEEIPRHYICPVSLCGKSYGSEGALTQHLKSKHKDSPELMELEKQIAAGNVGDGSKIIQSESIGNIHKMVFKCMLEQSESIREGSKEGAE